MVPGEDRWYVGNESSKLISSCRETNNNYPFSFLNHYYPFSKIQGQLQTAASISFGHDNDSYAPSLPEFDKEDRRPILGRIIGEFLKFFHRKEDDSDENYYQDNYNDQSWQCSFGTADDDGIWMNRKDQAGTIMSMLVWLLISELMNTLILLNYSGSTFCLYIFLSLTLSCMSLFSEIYIFYILKYTLESQSHFLRNTTACLDLWPCCIAQLVPWHWQVMPKPCLQILERFHLPLFQYKQWKVILLLLMQCARTANRSNLLYHITVEFAIDASVGWIIIVLG